MDELPRLSVMLSKAADFHEEIESSVTTVIYFLKDNLFAKGFLVIAKYSAWLVGGTAYPVEALMRWTKMQFGEMGCGVNRSQMRALCPPPN